MYFYWGYFLNYFQLLIYFIINMNFAKIWWYIIECI